MMLTHITVVRAARGRSEQLGQCLQALCEPARKMDGCLCFDVGRKADEPGAWLVHGEWRSSATLQAYFTAPLLQRVLDEALQRHLLGSVACMTYEQSQAA
ncbi:MAG: putative quinol monooxygenase [Pseudomonas sp.]|uniref:putative quinol monooxygenase n=1 Tax=Pseudomonas sp. TaxID=306 RepID=UPI003D115184